MHDQDALAPTKTIFIPDGIHKRYRRFACTKPLQQCFTGKLPLKPGKRFATHQQLGKFFKIPIYGSGTLLLHHKRQRTLAIDTNILSKIQMKGTKIIRICLIQAMEKIQISLLLHLHIRNILCTAVNCQQPAISIRNRC